MHGFLVFEVESPRRAKLLGQADLTKTRKDRIMEPILMGLICGGVVLIAPLFALAKASATAKELDDLKKKVHRLQGRLNEMSDQFADTESVPGPLGQAERPPETRPKESEIKQAGLAKPEPKHFTLPRDFKESLAARLGKDSREGRQAAKHK